MQWVKDNNSSWHRAELICSTSAFEYTHARELMLEAVRWCRKNNMMIWNDTLYTIRFTSIHDLAWFLLRWT